MRLGQIAMSLSTTVACLVYAFINGWKLTLVVLAIIPFLIIAAAIQMKFFAGGGGAGIGDDALVQSGKVSICQGIAFQELSQPITDSAENEPRLKLKARN